MRSSQLVLSLGLFASLAACNHGSRVAGLPTGPAAYAIVPPADPNAPHTSYVIVSGDVLNLQVFQEPDLSNAALQVDSVGNVQLPLIGEIAAADRTPAALAAEIARRLHQRYIVDPQVVVSVARPAPRYVTVEGQVNHPGVYEITSDATLLSAIARAESPTKVAKLDEVIIFRTRDGKRMVARFDLSDVRAGVAGDPQIIGGDTVVVGYSRTKGTFQNVLQMAPLLNVFYAFR